MTDPFRDEAAAATQRAEELEAENEELRARLAELEGSEGDVLFAELRREVEEAENASVALRMQVTELEKKRPMKGRWIVRHAFVVFFVGFLIGRWLVTALAAR